MIDKLQTIDIFKNLDDVTLQKIAKASSLKKAHKDNIIFYEGEKSHYLHILLSGQIKLYKTLPNNNELILKHFYAGEMIAEVAVFEGFNYPATAQATNDVELIQIEYPKLKKLFLSEPEILLQIQYSLIQKIKNLEHLLSRYLVLDAKSRVIEYILTDSQAFFSLKKSEVANILNISPETLSRILKPFKSDGIIDFKAKTLNEERLKLYL